MLKIEIDGIEETAEYLDEVAERSNSVFGENNMSYFSDIFLDTIKDSFKNRRSPEGVEWEGSADLRESGRLYKDVTSPSAVSINGNSFSFKSSVEYAGIHQYGSDSIRARPFVPEELSDDMIEAIGEYIIEGA